MKTTTSARTLVLGVVTMMILASSATMVRAEDRTPGETERAQVAPITVQHYIAHDSRSINQSPAAAVTTPLSGHLGRKYPKFCVLSRLFFFV